MLVLIWALEPCWGEPSCPLSLGLMIVREGKGDESPWKAWERGAQQRTEEKSYLRSASVSGPCTHWHNQGRQRTLLKGKRENKNWKTEPYTLIHSYAQHFNIFKALLHPLVHLTPKQSHEWTGHVLFIPFYEWGRKLRHRERSHMEVTESELKPVF